MKKNSFDELAEYELNRTASSPGTDQQNPQKYSANTRSSKKSNPIAGYIFLAFFIGCIGGMLFFSKTRPLISVICVGLLFTVLGFMAVSGKRKKFRASDAPLFIFPLLGLGMIAVPCYLMYVQKHPEADFVNWETAEQLMPVFFLMVFVIIGLGFIIIPPLSRKLKEKRCTLQTEAVCVKVNSHISRSRNTRSKRVYAPVWQYIVNGKEYTKGETTYSNFSVVQEGDTADLYVNPDDPEDFYRNVSAYNVFYALMGIAFAGLGIFGIIMYLSQ